MSVLLFTACGGESESESTPSSDSGSEPTLTFDPITDFNSLDCSSNMLFFEKQILPELTVCRSCHAAGSVAGNTRLLLSTNDAEANFIELEAIALVDDGGKSRLLTHPAKSDHFGGVQLIPDTNKYLKFSEMVNRYQVCREQDKSDDNVDISFFTASSATITTGQSVTLSWSSVEADLCDLAPLVDTVSTSGSVTLSPTESTQYTLTCSNGGSVDSESIAITVVEPQVTINNFSVSPSMLNLGQTAELSWNVTQANSCNILPNIGQVDSSSGSMNISPTATTQYTLTCSNDNDTEFATANVTVVEPQSVAINHFSVSPSVINEGQTAELSWTVSQAGTCNISPDIGQVNADGGTLTVTPLITTQYLITCSNMQSDASAFAEITVQPAPSLVEITQFNSSSSDINFGESVTLNWITQNADSCELSPLVGVVSTNGSISVTPDVDMTYSLICSNQDNSANADVFIAVTPSPMATIYQAQCATCHGENGEGVSTFPALTQVTGNLQDIIASVNTMPLGNTSGSFECDGIDNCAEQMAQYILDAFVDGDSENEAPIIQFTSSATEVISGGSITFNWTVHNADSCTISPEIGSVDAMSGSVDVTPLEDTEYSLSCSNQNENASATINITVNDILSIASIYQAQCATCHGENGEGVSTFPALTQVTGNLQDIIASVNTMPLGNTSGSFECDGIDNCAEQMAQYILDVFVDSDSETDLSFTCNIPEPAEGIAVKRLSRLEYQNTIYDILSERLNSSNAEAIVNDQDYGIRRLVPIDSHSSGYKQLDNRVSMVHVEGWFQFSLRLVEAVMPNITNFVGSSCAANPADRDCMRTFIVNFGRVLLRKPLQESQVDHYLTSSNYRTLLVRLFNSPDFIYHLEIDGVDYMGNDDLRELTAHELAARLSYTYWRSMPDANLRAMADNGSIISNFEQALSQVVDSPKARRGMDAYFADWWELEKTAVPSEYSTRGLRLVDSDPGSADTSLSIDFDPQAYHDDAIQEVLALAEYLTFESQGTVSELHSNNRSFARTADLAKAYGVPTWNGDFNNAIYFPAGQRSGLVTRAAFHLYGGANTNPILKGVRVRKRMLCDDIPLPENNTPPNVNPGEDWTVRDLITAQTESTSSCAACHQTLINPAGFATEDYDSLGRFRAMEYTVSVAMIDPDIGQVDGNVFPVIEKALNINANSTPRLESENDLRGSSSGFEFSSLMAETARTSQCVARSLFRHSFARMEVTEGDGCMLRDIDAAASSGTLKEAIRAMALRPEFRLRKLPD